MKDPRDGEVCEGCQYAVHGQTSRRGGQCDGVSSLRLSMIDRLIDG